MNAPQPGISVYHGVVALGLLLGPGNPTALRPPTPVRVRAANVHPSASVANTAPAPITLTPIAPATSSASPVGEDIRGIRRPRHLHQTWFWAAIAVGVVTFLGAAVAFWRWLRHGKFFVMRPDEIALQGLDEARRLMDPDYTRVYCLEASKVLRRYTEEQLHLHSAQLTTEEFLRELAESQETLLASHRALLGDFLQHCVLTKFAGWRYCRPDLEAMHDSAVEFVRQTGAAISDADKNRASTTTRPMPNDSSVTDAHNSPIA
jgi:hypothetical protein